ncbi:hypothetical protein J6590_019959 [Homalodisca vitripennis]|nr:hypothetical protein J6590_019959 [Homalodisca vitripennis]
MSKSRKRRKQGLQPIMWLVTPKQISSAAISEKRLIVLFPNLTDNCLIESDVKVLCFFSAQCRVAGSTLELLLYDNGLSCRRGVKVIQNACLLVFVRTGHGDSRKVTGQRRGYSAPTLAKSREEAGARTYTQSAVRRAADDTILTAPAVTDQLIAENRYGSATFMRLSQTFSLLRLADSLIKLLDKK